MLRARLYEQERERQQAELAATRRSQIGGGERAEKIRTYNFPENRLTDHRIKLTVHQLDRILQGELGRVHRGARRRGPPPRARGVRDEAEGKTDSEAVEVGARRCRDAEGVTVAEALAASSAGWPRPAWRRRGSTPNCSSATRSERPARRSTPSSGRELSAQESAGLERLVARREAREPLAYVLGEWGFRRLTLKVDRRVLVPRPETEVVVERCLELLRGLDRAGGARRRHRLGRDRARDRRRASRARVSPRSTSRRCARGRARERSGHRARGRLRASATSATVSTALTTSSSRTRRTSPPRRSRRSSPRCATGSRGSRRSATEHTEAIAAASARVLVPAATSCSRSPTAGPRRSRELLRRLGYDGRAQRRGPGRPRPRRRGTMVERAVAALRRGRAGDSADRHGLRALRRARAGRPTGGAEGTAGSTPVALLCADVERLLELVPEAAAYESALARAVHARPPESGGAVPRAGRRRDDRRARARARRAPPRPSSHRSARWRRRAPTTTTGRIRVASRTSPPSCARRAPPWWTVASCRASPRPWST